jgi:hypothetical protein
MLRFLTDAEVKESDERKACLYQSAYTIDNLTAVLMDSSKGGMGLYEETARAKAHGVIDWLRSITGVEVPGKKPSAVGNQQGDVKSMTNESTSANAERVRHEYWVMDIGFSNAGLPAEMIINKVAEDGWRLIAVAQRVGNGSDAIRHYFERERRQS